MDGFSAILMAAGKGVRMRSSKPKVLHHIAGLSMIRHVVAAANHVAPEQTVVVVAPDNAEAIAGELGEDVEYAEQPEPLGTGHALQVALERVPAGTRHVLLLNGDMPLVTGTDLAALCHLHVDRAAALTLGYATLPLEQARDLGTLQRGARGKPIGVVEAAERDDRNGAPAMDAIVGAYAFDAAWVRGAVKRLSRHAQGELYVTDLVAMAVTEGRRVEAFEVASVRGCVGVNTRGQLANAEHAMQQRLREQAMAGGVTLIDPATVYIDATVRFGTDVVVKPNTTIGGASEIGNDVTLGPNAQVYDSIVGEGAVIGSAIVRASRIGAGAQVGPFSLLREGSELAAGAYVGAHAEIKASRIGAGTHVGHFSYVGDARVGDNANIGAGTVTCNYDGVNKHVTEIGDGAFIGSGSMLIAPLKIGKGALTGAGAVVREDVPDGGRVAGVPARAIASRSRQAG